MRTRVSASNHSRRMMQKLPSLAMCDYVMLFELAVGRGLIFQRSGRVISQGQIKQVRANETLH